VSPRQDRRHDRGGRLSARRGERRVLDTVVATETPEGIVLELRPAGLAVRYYAFALDWVIRLSVIYGAAMVASVLGGIGMAFWIILIFALDWFYPVVFELSASGATPGKRVFGLRVLMDNGLPVTAAASMTRNLLRVADFLPLGYAAAIICLLLRADGKRLGDLAAGTLVVHQPRAESRAVLDDVPLVAPVRPLAPEDQAALIALAPPAPRVVNEKGQPMIGRQPSGYDANLRWLASPGAVGYRIYRRGPWAQTWESFLPVGNVTGHVGQGQSIDDWVFGVAAVGGDGHESLISAYVPRSRTDADIKFLNH
jgi:uncharacterized RDD family membrane protein YckC